MARRRSKRVPLALLVTVLAGLAACDGLPSFGAPDSASEDGDRLVSLWQGFVVAALAIAGIVWGLLVFVLVRYRRRSDDVPSQSPYNVRIEVLYTVAPILIVIALFGFSWATEDDVVGLEAHPDVQLEVVGFQWQWRFTYPEEDITLIGTPETGPPEVVLPVDRVVRLDLVSEDVNHAFWVPNFFEKRDLIPGVENTIDLTPNRTGAFAGRCAEFCGLDHWRMGFTVRVVDQAEYEAWLAEQRAAAGA